MAFNSWSCLDFGLARRVGRLLNASGPPGLAQSRAEHVCISVGTSLQTEEDCLSMHSAFCGLRDRWHTLLVEGAIIGPKRWGGGHCSEIYGDFTFFLIHCPANTAITAAARRGRKTVLAMRNVLLVVKQRQESRRMTYGRKHSITAAAHPQPDSRTNFSVWSFGPLKGQFTQDFHFGPPTPLPACYWSILDPETLTQPHPHYGTGIHNQREFWLMEVCCGRGFQPN